MKLRSLIVTLALAAACRAQSAPAPAAKPTFDKARIEALVRYVDVFRGKVEVQIGEPKPSKYLPGYREFTVHLTFENGGTRDDIYFASADGETIIKGAAYNLGLNPFQSNLDRVTTNDDPSFGPAHAPVTLVEFGDFQCPDCKNEAPVLRRALPQMYGDKVRVVFKNFPLESIHPWARPAAIASRCVFRQNAESFWKYYDWIYDQQSEVTPDNVNERILGWAGTAGLDAGKLKACMESKAAAEEVDAATAQAHAIGAGGTPTLVINGRRIGGLQWPDLQIVINIELQKLGFQF